LYLRSIYNNAAGWCCRFALLLLLTGASLFCPGHALAQQEADADAEQEEHIYDSSINFFNWKINEQEKFSPAKVNAASNARVQQLKASGDFWYMREPGVLDSLGAKPTPPAGNKFSFRMNTETARIVNWCVIVLVFLGGVVYFLRANKIRLFSWQAGRRSFTEVTSGSGEDIFRLPYADWLQQACARQDYRLAVRVLYLQTLQLLDKHNLIRFQPGLTNVDYLLQLKQSPYYAAFAAITRHYEYIWYGEQVIGEQTFQQVQNDFVHIQKMVQEV
jgi:hypothetical protein